MDQHAETRHLRYFLALAEELHFGRAAQRLHIAQPALSQQIRQLEKIIGVELFQRTSRSVRLTEAGATFQQRARDLLGRLAADVNEAGRIGRGEAGRLDVAFSGSAAAIVSEHLRAFSRLRPDVQVTSHDGMTADVLESLERGTADVAIVRDVQERDDLTLTLLATERLVAVVPAEHPAAERKRIEASALAADRLILFRRSAGAHAFDLYTQPLRNAGVDVDVALECSNWHTVMTFVAAGLGVSIAPYSVTSPLPSGARRVELGGPPTASTVHIAIRRGDDRPILSALIAAFDS